MDSYNVIISPKALSQLNSYIDYIQYTLLNEQAAQNVWQDGHRYLMLYHIDEKTVYVDAIYHQLQDYENIFAHGLNLSETE